MSTQNERIDAHAAFIVAEGPRPSAVRAELRAAKYRRALRIMSGAMTAAARSRIADPEQVKARTVRKLRRCHAALGRGYESLQRSRGMLTGEGTGPVDPAHWPKPRRARGLDTFTERA